jgi:hypothetical protein
VIVDCHLEPIYNYLEHQAIAYLYFMERRNSMPPFVQDDLTFVGVGMDNPLAFFAALDHH